MNILLRAASVTSLIVVAGCLDSADPVDAVHTSETEQQAGGSCPVWMCGSNSPEIDHKGLHELSRTGRYNPQGFYISQLKHPNGHKYVLEVYRGIVSAVSTSGGPTLTNITSSTTDGLDDLLIIVKYDADGAGPGAPAPGSYDLRFAQRGRVAFWARPGGMTYYATSYLMQWDDSLMAGTKRQWKNICSAPPSDNGDTLGMDRFHSVVFEGDRIDADRKVDYDIDKDFFNIGCAGHALAKLHLMGHTEAARNLTPAFDTNLESRTAALKMLVADYCGDGTAFTVAGQPLQWQDELGWMNYTSVTSLEAQWTSAGARCLDVPRVRANPTAAGTAAFPDIEAAIASQCRRPPRCTTSATDFSASHINSANP